MMEFTKDNIEHYRKQYALWTSRRQTTPEEIHLIARLRDALDEIERLQARIAELEQEHRWIPVRDWPPEVGWHRVITNNGTEQIRQYVRVPDRDIHYWDVKENESIMMYTYPTLPQPPKEGE